MFKTTISAFSIEGQVLLAVASPSLNRIAVSRPEQATTGPLVEIYDSTALVAPLDRSRMTTAEGLSSSPSSSPSGLGQFGNQTTTKIASITIFPSRDCHARRWYQHVTAMAWLDNSVLAVLCRNERGSSTSLTVISLVNPADSTDSVPNAPTWATPSWSRLVDGAAWVVSLSSHILRQYILCGKKDALIELTYADSVAPEPAELTEGGLSMEDVEQFIVDGVWQLADDGIRDAVWIQLDQVLASVKFRHLGNGMFMYHVLHRIPLNNNILTLEHGLKPLKWASAMRVVFVYDEEFSEVKVWSLQVSTAICIANIPVHAAVSQIFCSDDATVLIAVLPDGLRLFNTDGAFRSFSTAHAKSKRRVDFLRTLAGAPLEQEQSVVIPWSAVDRSSKAKLRLFRDKPHAFSARLADSRSKFERCAVVENNISVLTVSGEAAVFTSTGEVLDETNILTGGESKAAVFLHTRRPPLPNHVLQLVMSERGVIAHFATNQINKDELLRNEIKFDFLSTALLLCNLNGWNTSDIQEKTLSIAIADSPEAVFNVINETFSLERDASSLGGGCAQPARPIATLQLLVRLCNAICSRFDNCPDDLQARQALRSLIAVTISACSVVESHCATLVPKSSIPLLLQLIDESAPIAKPFAVRSTAVPLSLDDNESAVADGGATVEVDARTTVEDVYLLMSLVAGLRSAHTSIPQGSIITVTTNSFNWSPQRSQNATVPLRSSLLLSPTQEEKFLKSRLDETASFRNDWASFCSAVLQRVHKDGVGSACAFINNNLPLLSNDLRHKLDELCIQDPNVNYFSEVVTIAKAPTKRLSDLVSDNTFVAHLRHVQLLVSRLVLAQLQSGLSTAGSSGDDAAGASQSSAPAGTAGMSPASSRDELCASSSAVVVTAVLPVDPLMSLEILVKTFSRKKALQWWATARRRTISPQMRSLLDAILLSYSAPVARPLASSPREEESLILLLDVVASPHLESFCSSQPSTSGGGDSTSATAHFARTFALRAAYSHGRFALRKDSARSLNMFKVPPQNEDDGDEADENPSAGRLSRRLGGKYVRTVEVADLDEHRGVIPVGDISEAAGAMVLKPNPPPCYCPMAVSWIEGTDTATQAQYLAPAVFETLVFQRRDVKLVDGATAALRVLTGEASCSGTSLAFLEAVTWFTAAFHQALVKGGLNYCVVRLDAEAAAWLAVNSDASMVASAVLDIIAEIQASHLLETPVTSKMKYFVLECALASATRSAPGRFAELLKVIQPLFKAQQQLPLGFSTVTPLKMLTQALETPATRKLALSALVDISTESLVPLSKYILISLLDQSDAWASLDPALLERLGDDDIATHYFLQRAEIKTSPQLALAVMAAVAPNGPGIRSESSDVVGAISNFIATVQSSHAAAGFEGVMVTALAGVKWSALPPLVVQGMLRALIELDADYASLCFSIAAQVGSSCVQEVAQAVAESAGAGNRPSGGKGGDVDDSSAQRQRLIDMACKLNASSANSRVMELLADPNKGLRLRRDGTNAKSVGIPSREVTEDFFSTEAKASTRAAASLHQWICVESIVRNAEKPEDVVVDSWELLADGRPITAFHMLQSLSESREAIIQCAREFAIARAHDFRNVAIYASFLFLLEPREFTRILLDAAVVQRLLKFTKGPQGKAVLQSIKLIPLLVLPTADNKPDPSSIALIANTLQMVTELLTQSASSELDDDGVPPSILVARFVMMYGTAEDAQAVIASSVSDQLWKKDWVQALYILWATQSSTCHIADTAEFQSQLPLLHILQQQRYCPDDDLLVAQRLPANQNDNTQFVKCLFLPSEGEAGSGAQTELGHILVDSSTAASTAESSLLTSIIKILLATSDCEAAKIELQRLLAEHPPPQQFAQQLVLTLVGSASPCDIAAAAELFQAANGNCSKQQSTSDAHFTSVSATCLHFHIFLSQHMYQQAAVLAKSSSWPSDASSGWPNVIRRTLERLMLRQQQCDDGSVRVFPSYNALTLYKMPIPNLCHVVRKWIDAALQVLMETSSASSTPVREVAAHILCSSFVLQAFVSGRPFSDSQLTQGILAAANQSSSSSLVLSREAVEDFFRVQVGSSLQSVVSKAEKHFLNVFSQSSGTLFACRVERSAFLETVFDYFVEEIGAAEDVAAKTLLRLTLAHIGPYDLTTDIVLLHIFLHEQHVAPIDPAVGEVAEHSNRILNCVSSAELPPLVLAALLQALAGNSPPVEDAPSLPSDVDKKLLPIMQHNPAFRTWASKRFALGEPAELSQFAKAAAQRPASSIEAFLKKDLAKELTEATADSSLSSEAVRVTQWKAVSSILSSGEPEAIGQLGQYITLQTDFLAAESHSAAVDKFVDLAAMSVMRAHVVPVLIDCAEKLYAREKVKYPHGLKDFESITGHYFFREDVLSPKGGPYNLFGLGESSGWMARARIEAICDMLTALGGTLGDGDGARNSCPSSVAASFGSAVFHHLDKFQSIVSLPNKAFYSKIFLEAVALVVVVGSWTLRKCYDHKLARAIAQELQTVVNFSLSDGDFELVRKIIFSYPDMALLRFVFDIIPVPLLASMGSASPVFLQQPLHLCSVRVATMSFLETLCEDDELAKRGKIELTTLYLNFRNFTALGEQLHADGNRMLETYITNTSNQKKGLLDKEKETLKRQTKMLEEVEAKFLQAASLYIQDSLFERCLMCIRDLCVISVQKKTTTKVLGLPVDQVIPVLQSWEDPYDVIALAYGFQITSAEDWATICYRQVVVGGRKEFWTAMRALSICVMPDLGRRIANLHRGEVPSTKEAPARNANYQWLMAELQRGGQ